MSILPIPWCSDQEARHEYGLELTTVKPGYYDAIIIAVAHREFVAMGAEAIHALGRDNHVLYDLKYVLAKESVDMRL